MSGKPIIKILRIILPAIVLVPVAVYAGTPTVNGNIVTFPGDGDRYKVYDVNAADNVCLSWWPDPDDRECELDIGFYRVTNVSADSSFVLRITEDDVGDNPDLGDPPSDPPADHPTVQEHLADLGCAPGKIIQSTGTDAWDCIDLPATMSAPQQAAQCPSDVVAMWYDLRSLNRPENTRLTPWIDTINGSEFFNENEAAVVNEQSSVNPNVDPYRLTRPVFENSIEKQLVDNNFDDSGSYNRRYCSTDKFVGGEFEDTDRYTYASVSALFDSETGEFYNARIKIGEETVDELFGTRYMTSSTWNENVIVKGYDLFDDYYYTPSPQSVSLEDAQACAILFGCTASMLSNEIEIE